MECVCVTECVISKPQQWGGSDPLGLDSQEKKNSKAPEFLNLFVAVIYIYIYIYIYLQQQINPLVCTECGDSLPFSGACSIPPCHTLFPATPLR